MAEQTRIRKTSSVETVFNALRSTEPVDASEIARRFFQLHPTYAGGKAATATLQDSRSIKQPAQWLSEIEALYDVSRIQAQGSRKQAVSKGERARARDDTPELNGRLA